ncbi:vacuolar fusion protein MON1, partial [Baffinella frigidus]
LERVFKKRSNFDLRNLLGASGEQVLSNLVGAMDAHKLSSNLPLHSAISFVFGAPHCARLSLSVRSQEVSFVFGAPHCARLSLSVRSQINTVNKALLSVQSPNLIYAILLARTQLVQFVRPRKNALWAEECWAVIEKVQFVRPRKTALWAEDLLLVVNLVNSSSSFRESEGTWTPLCLPLYSPDANVFAYICFLHKHQAPDVCLVLVTSSDDEFFSLAESKDKIADVLHNSGALARIQDAANHPPFLVEEVQAAPFSISKELLHFVYFSTSMNQFIAPGFSPPFWSRQFLHLLYFSTSMNQFIAPGFSPPFWSRQAKQRLLRQYQAVSHWVHRQQARVQHK